MTGEQLDTEEEWMRAHIVERVGLENVFVKMEEYFNQIAAVPASEYKHRTISWFFAALASGSKCRVSYLQM